jgi:DHA2 family multidrug resistance protein-like MFS transporter
LVDAARSAFTSGLHLGAFTAAGIAAVAAVLAVTRLRHIPPTGTPAGAESVPHQQRG